MRRVNYCGGAPSDHFIIYTQGSGHECLLEWYELGFIRGALSMTRTCTQDLSILTQAV